MILEEDFYKAPPDNCGVRTALQAMHTACGAVRVFSIGKSVLGRRIWAAAIGNVRRNAATLFVGGVHGQEYITTLLLIRFLESITIHLAKNERMLGVDIGQMLCERGVVVVPLFNPDGVEIATKGAQSAGRLAAYVRMLQSAFDESWQANANGVDLNHNFDAGFTKLKVLEAADGIRSPRPRRYGGKHPHSEPETQALVQLCHAFWFRSVYAFHAQGEEIYYRYGPHTPAKAEFLAHLLAAACGYTVAEPSGTASHGGFKDWFINFYHRPGFTIEIGRGENPLPLCDLEPIYIRLRELLITALAI